MYLRSYIIIFCNLSHAQTKVHYTNYSGLPKLIFREMIGFFWTLKRQSSSQRLLSDVNTHKQRILIKSSFAPNLFITPSLAYHLFFSWFTRINLASDSPRWQPKMVDHTLWALFIIYILFFFLGNDAPQFGLVKPEYRYGSFLKNFCSIFFFY